ncbi:unnamed protein product [Linum tenue]|uniref:Uncharacterized protein n=1 Tax=Linum tenue TaxID=586396 RepID=A0AAV0RJI5_9ROSI|nr:unnamed protein product [Linum tenue]
MCRSLARRA